MLRTEGAKDVGKEWGPWRVRLLGRVTGTQHENTGARSPRRLSPTPEGVDKMRTLLH